MGLGCSFRPRIRRKRESEDVLCARTRRSRRRLWHTRYGAGQDMMLPNPGATSKEDLARFKFLGKLIGVAARQGICLPLRWPSIVWKQLVHQPGVSADLAAYDQSFMDHVLAALQVRTSACQLCSCGSQCQLLTLRFNGCRRVLCSPADVARRRLTVAALPASTTVLCSQMGARRSIWFLMGAPSLCLQIEVGLGCHCGVVLCTYHSVQRLFWWSTVATWAKLAVEARLTECSAQVAAIHSGLRAVLPVELLRLYSWCVPVVWCGCSMYRSRDAFVSREELQLELCGQPKMDVDLLRRHTRLEGYSWTDPTIKAFWRALQSMTSRQQAAVLRFTWARERLPINSSRFTMPFVIVYVQPVCSGRHGVSPHSFALPCVPHRLRYAPTTGNPDRSLPCAHTCSFRLDLPRYSSMEVLKRQLLLAAESCVGYALALFVRCALAHGSHVALPGRYDLDGGARGISALDTDSEDEDDADGMSAAMERSTLHTFGLGGSRSNTATLRAGVAGASHGFRMGGMRRLSTALATWSTATHMALHDSPSHGGTAGRDDGGDPDSSDDTGAAAGARRL